LPVNTSETVSSTLDEEVSVPDMEYGAPPLTRPAPSVPLTLSPLPAYLPVSSPALSDLYLAVALLPRLPRHHLIGDLAALLPQWISQICMAYAWRLEAMRVRPDYVEWVVNIPPATSASLHLRIMRRQTSQFIFAEFPTIARENPSGDFWASGYLVTSSSQLPTEAAIQAFISQVRQQQGVSKLFPERS
jgi:REP element-mobilizing transposase RayT